MDCIAWLHDLGNSFYPLAFLWAFFEGETFVIFGGIGAKAGVINLTWLIAAVWLGSFFGDQMWFWLGRKWGAKALRRFPKTEARAEKVLEWVDRYGVGFILVFRFLYGVRNVASIIMGTSNMPWRRFLVWNFLAAGIWALSFGGAGYLFGEAAASIGEDGPKILLLIFLSAGGLYIGLKSLLWVRRRVAAAETQA